MEYEELFTDPEQPANRDKDDVLLAAVRRAAEAFDRAGEPTAAITLFKADFSRVRKKLGVRYGKAYIGDHLIVNIGPRHPRVTPPEPSMGLPL